MSALLHPSKLKQRCVKWPLVAHTVAMFSFATVSTMTGLYNGVISFLDARKFPGSSGFPPGPVGYIRLINYRAIGVVGNTPLLLNGWLADGLLVYFMSSLVVQVTYVGWFFSYIVATLFMA